MGPLYLSEFAGIGKRDAGVQETGLRAPGNVVKAVAPMICAPVP